MAKHLIENNDVMSKDKNNNQPQQGAENAAPEQKNKKTPRIFKGKIEELEARQKELTAKLSEKDDDYKKLMAEFDTFRRRTAQEKLDLVGVASADTIKELLPTLDACESALKMLKEDDPSLQGIKLISDTLMNCLEKRGLKKMDVAGEPFNSDEHEAITMIPAPSEDMKGKVIEVFRTGYSLNGKVIRYPQVIVGQ